MRVDIWIELKGSGKCGKWIGKDLNVFLWWKRLLASNMRSFAYKFSLSLLFLSTIKNIFKIQKASPLHTVNWNKMHNRLLFFFWINYAIIVYVTTCWILNGSMIPIKFDMSRLHLAIFFRFLHVLMLRSLDDDEKRKEMHNLFNKCCVHIKIMGYAPFNNANNHCQKPSSWYET